MQSFARGWSFLKEAWSMAFKDKDLIKPSIYALLVGFVVSVVGIPDGQFEDRSGCYLHPRRADGFCPLYRHICFFGHDRLPHFRLSLRRDHGVADERTTGRAIAADEF